MYRKMWDDIPLVKRLYDYRMQPVCEQYQITLTELEILFAIGGRPALDTNKEMVKRRNLTKSLVSTSVKRLAERGYVNQTFRGTNRKTIYLELSEEGKQAFHCGRQAQMALFSALFHGFRPVEIRRINASLDRIAHNAELLSIRDVAKIL